MRCGIGDYLQCLAEAIAATGQVDVFVYTSNSSEVLSSEGNPKVMPVVQHWNWWSVAKISKAVTQMEPDIVHIQYPTAGYKKSKAVQFLPAFIKARNNNIKIVQTWHDPFNFYWKGKVRFIPNLLAIDGLITVEPGWVEMLPAIYRQCLSKKIKSVIPLASSIPTVCLNTAERQEIHERFGCVEDERLFTYFGFVSPRKGVENIFQIIQSIPSKLILICDLDPMIPHHKSILEKIREEEWSNRIQVTGYLPAVTVARYLAAADAAILPFQDGVSPRYTSFLAAVTQGTLVVTTSYKKKGYFQDENMYYASPGDLQALSEGLRQYSGRRIDPLQSHIPSWKSIAHEHVEFYEKLLTNQGPSRIRKRDEVKNDYFM
jgi:glycosyltransferase involved in cell wall biosynthesis